MTIRPYQGPPPKLHPLTTSPSPDAQVENVIVEIPFTKSVLNMTMTATQGKYTFDPVSKLLTWDLGRIDSTKLPSIKGNVRQHYDVPCATEATNNNSNDNSVDPYPLK